MITDIIKTTFLKLNKDKVPATPDMYRKYFCKEARRLGVYHSECNSINSLLDTLSYRNRQIIKKLKINSMEDLLKFLITQLENASKVTNEDKENKKDDTVVVNQELIDVAKVIQEALSPLSKATNNITKNLAKTFNASSKQTEKLSTIKEKLSTLDNAFFENQKHTGLLKTHFISIADSMEKEARNLSTTLMNNVKEIHSASKEITKIQEDLMTKQEDKMKIDKLTKLYTKKGILDILQATENMFNVDKKAYSFLLFDIDKFDKINKLHGVKAGDTILKEFANLLSREFKKDGAVARLENNKFLIVLLESDLDKIVKIANNISDILSKEHFEYNKTKIRFTVSGAINTRTNYKSQEIMLKEIENILQNAKHNGRNRIEMR